MIERWISEMILAILRRFVDIDWENLQIGWWSGKQTCCVVTVAQLARPSQAASKAHCGCAGFTLDDICIRQDIFASLGLPLELHEGKIRRLHVSGDWTYSSGLRPRIEISGVRILARVTTPHGPPPAASTSGPVTPATAKPSSSVLRSLLRRLCASLTDIEVVLVDSISPSMRPATAGLSIRSISTEDSASGRSPANVSPALSSTPCNHFSVDFGGAFFVPAVAPEKPPWLQPGWQDLPSPPATTSLHPEAITSVDSAQDWLVVHPCSVLVRSARAALTWQYQRTDPKRQCPCSSAVLCFGICLIAAPLHSCLPYFYKTFWRGHAPRSELGLPGGDWPLIMPAAAVLSAVTSCQCTVHCTQEVYTCICAWRRVRTPAVCLLAFLGRVRLTELKTPRPTQREVYRGWWTPQSPTAAARCALRCMQCCQTSRRRSPLGRRRTLHG